MDNRDQFSEKGFSTRRHSATLLGLIIVIAGLLFLASNVGLLPKELTRVLLSWPMVLVAVGIFHLVSQRTVSGALWLLAGIFFLIRKFDIIPANYYPIVWPSILILAGLVLLLTRDRFLRGIPNRSYQRGDVDAFQDVNIFGGGKRQVDSKNFKGAEITCIFGGGEYSFIDTELAPDITPVINVTTIFGGAEIVVPNDWTVLIETTNILGGFDDKRRNTVADPNKKVIITGFTMFGGGEIKSY